MKILTRTAAAALLITLPMALGACGGDSSKPPKSQVEAGFSKAMKVQLGASDVPAPMLQKMSSCTIDKVYGKVSNKTLNAIKSGDTSKKISSDDESKLTKAVNDCKSSMLPS